jgi:hypothetical protein
MYPPVFPLFLAPMIRLFGMNLLAMKIEQVIFFVLALAVVSLCWRRDLGPECTLALVAILGFCPHFWAAKDNVLSDLLFLLLFYVAALLVQRVPRCDGNQWRWAILIGLVLYLAIGTRTAGVALITGLLLHDLVKHRTVTRIAMIALSTCAGLIFLQSRFLSSGFSGYAGQAHPTTRTVAAHLFSYPRTLAGFWVASTQTPFSFLVLGIISLFTLVGLWNRRSLEMTAVEAFLVPYAAIVLLWPFSPGIRLVFPIIPWMVFLALSGLRTLTAQIAPRHLATAVSAFLLLIAVPYTNAYRHTDFGPIRQSAGLPEFNELCRAVREQTTSQDVLIYFRARALSLYTDRTASAYNFQGTDEDFWDYARNIHATYLITTNAFDEDHGFLARSVARRSSSLELRYENANFKLYRILPDTVLQTRATFR